jgi:hypothetical protein
MKKQDVIKGVSSQISWWIEQRKKKLQDLKLDTMSINPFLLPILFDLHNLDSLHELSSLTGASHLMIGHNTGFGKLMDEKILPEVFGTQKLDKKHRASIIPYKESCFNEIDHVLKRQDGKVDLLSLKASKWTIQLTMAMQLNHSFNTILNLHGKDINEIAVGVIYGKKEQLTDKYDILRGVNRGANHDVTDITGKVNVYAGRAFWAWLNNGELLTQDWVLEGVIKGVKETNTREEGGKLLRLFNGQIANEYQHFITDSNEVNWMDLLNHING